MGRECEMEGGTMSARESINVLIPELVAIQSGHCIWCDTGKAHPEYSRCPHNPKLSRSFVANATQTQNSHGKRAA